MENTVKVAVDAMGGDNAPRAVIEGVIEALEEYDALEVTLIGNEESINSILKELNYEDERLNLIYTTQIVEMAEHPVNAIRTKKDSSMVKGMNLVKEGTCDAFVTAGNSGAVLVGGQLIVGRIRGIDRPPLAPIIPTQNGACLLVDCGANVDARAPWLVQFAKMGSIYVENMLGIKNPRVALFNIGAEEEKGNALVKEVYPMLKECEDINFIGNIEARDIPFGKADVVVCDAFVGNAILKMYEGASQVFLKELKSTFVSSLRTKIGALLLKPALKKTLKNMDSSSYGGAPLLGTRGLVVKAHGNSKKTEIKNALGQCLLFHEKKINEQIKEKILLK